MEYPHLIYDFADRLPSATILIPLLILGFGIAVYIYSQIFIDKNTTAPFLFYGEINKRKQVMIFGIFIALFGLLISIIAVPSMTQEYLETKKIYDKKEYFTVEGIVENYHPMPSGGHAYEKFTVKDVEFSFSDFDMTNYGYNNAASRGGAIRSGLKVKIGYFNNGLKNVILKLETE